MWLFILLSVLWYAIGCFGFYRWWTKEYDLTTKQLGTMLSSGFIGVFSFVVAWSLDCEENEKSHIQKTKVMEYKLPKLKDLRVDKLQYFEMLNELKDTEHIPIKDIVKLNAIFTGLDESYLLTVTKKSNYELSNSIMALLNSYKPKEISTTIRLNGQEYVLQEDLGKMPTAFWVDLSNQDMAKNPIRMASSIYIEKGMKYSQLDSNKNIINPVSKRDEIFKEHLPLTDFLDIQGFFLRRYNELTPLYMEAKVIQAQKLQADINGMMS